MKNIALFPGSFDPYTKGHDFIVSRALPLFDQIIIAIGYNSDKSGFFPLEKRIQWLKNIYSNQAKITIASYQGLTVDFCRSIGANYILRGVRNSIDFEYEKNIGQMNRALAPEIETILMFSSPELSAINSTIIRDIIRHGGDASAFVPEGIEL